MNEIILKEKKHHAIKYMKIIIAIVKLYLILLPILIYEINFVLLLSHISMF